MGIFSSVQSVSPRCLGLLVDSHSVSSIKVGLKQATLVTYLSYIVHDFHKLLNLSRFECAQIEPESGIVAIIARGKRKSKSYLSISLVPLCSYGWVSSKRRLIIFMIEV